MLFFDANAATCARLGSEVLILFETCKRLVSSAFPAQPRETRRAQDLVEHAGAPDEQGEADDLQPFECLPTQAETYDPDEEGAAGVDGATRGGGKGASHGQAEEVEAAVELLARNIRQSEWKHTQSIA